MTELWAPYAQRRPSADQSLMCAVYLTVHACCGEQVGISHLSLYHDWGKHGRAPGCRITACHKHCTTLRQEAMVCLRSWPTHPAVLGGL